MSVDARPPRLAAARGGERLALGVRPHAAAGRRGGRLLRGPSPVRGRRRGPRRAVRRARAARRPRLRGGPARAPVRARGGSRSSPSTSRGRCSQTVGAKADGPRGCAVGRVQANLCRLGCFPDGTLRLRPLDVQHAGDDPRAARRGGGRWPRRSASSGPAAGSPCTRTTSGSTCAIPRAAAGCSARSAAALLGRPDAGDRRMTYRGIPGMEVHLYRWGELRRDLRAAGFRIDEVSRSTPSGPSRSPCPGWVTRSARGDGSSSRAGRGRGPITPG